MLGFSCRKLGPISFVRKPRVSLATFQTLPAWRIRVRASAAHTCMTTPLGPPRSRRPPVPELSRKPDPRAFTILDSAGRGRVQLPHSSSASFGQGKLPGQDFEIRRWRWKPPGRPALIAIDSIKLWRFYCTGFPFLLGQWRSRGIVPRRPTKCCANSSSGSIPVGVRFATRVTASLR